MWRAARRRRRPADTDDEISPDLLTMPFPIGGPATSAWREQAFSRATDYRFLARLLLSHATERDRQALQAIERQIDTAERAAAGRRGQPKAKKGDDAKNGEPGEPSLGRFGQFLSVLSGAGVERANSQLDGVETDLLRLAPDPYLRGHLPSLVAHVRDHLSDRDPRRLQVEKVAADVGVRPSEIPLSALERDQVLGAVRSASLESRQKIRRVRSFRNVLLVSALILTLGVAGLTVLGAAAPERLPMCFAPDNAVVVCPMQTKKVPEPRGAEPGTETASEQVRVDRLIRKTASSWDIPIVEMVGLLAAALAGALALRSIPGTSTPYSLPLAITVLKLPSGALTAVVGLWLMRGGFVPGLSALDSSAQIIAWAIVLGYAQQLLTRFVDQQANVVLENVSQPTSPQLSPVGTPTTDAPGGA
jgi:hypothetical protein